MKNYKYLEGVLKEIAIKNESLGLNPFQLKNYFKNYFSDIIFDIDSLSEYEKLKLKNKFKKIKHLEINIKDINLNDYLTLDYLCTKVSIFIKNKKTRYQSLENLFENLSFENTRIVTSMKIDYVRKDKTYHKKTYIITTRYMIQNIKNNSILQFFTDVTYYATPTVSKKYKIFSILGFDTKERKTQLCVLALISNENHETFGAIFLHLKKSYNFHPKYITSDFNKACISAINRIFPDAIFIPCYFHYVQNCLKHLPENKSNKDNIKNKALDLMANIKILCFIKLEYIFQFFEKIKEKYQESFPNFIKYFEKNYLNSDQYGHLTFNYNYLRNDDIS